MEKIQVIKENKNSYFGSLAFLFFVILMTIGLLFYNKYLENSSSSLKNIISKYTESINSYNEDSKFNIYSLMQLNKKNLDVLVKNSQVTKYINNIDEIEKKYDLNFKGFNLNNGRIGTTIFVSSDDSGSLGSRLAYSKLTSFINEYRDNKDALFDLDFINQISGHDEMKLNINFTIK